MKNNWILKGVFSIIFVSALFAACKKDRTIITIDNTSKTVYYPLNAVSFWNNYLPAKQTFVLDATNGGWIKGSKGCNIYIGANSLEDAAGMLVAGNVDVELIEYMNKADMAFSGVTTVSGNQLLESGGMFYLNIKKGGTELKMKAGKLVQLIIPQTNKTADAMDFFKGNVNAAGDVNKVNWVLKDSIKVVPKKDTGQFGRGVYSMQFNYFQFGFCNIDRFWGKFKTKCKKFRIKMPKGCNDTNSTALLLFKDYNSCAWCQWMTTEDRISTGYELPSGETIKVLVYKKTGPGDDDISYQLQEVMMTLDIEVEFIDNFIKTNKAGLADIIKAL